MKTETLEELAKGRLRSKVLLRLVFVRIAKIIAICLIFVLLSWLILLENLAWLSFLLGTILGFSMFLALRFFESRFGESRNNEAHTGLPELKNLTDSEETKRISAVED
jgi:uncharacterized protein YneF (UPF0154 family)